MDDGALGGFAIGDSPRRLEDERLLRGRGRYLDDLADGDTVHAVVVRSPHAHARLRGVDGSAARSMPGVLAVLSGAEQAAAGIAPLLPHMRVNPHDGAAYRFEPQPILALERVRYVGEPVALVVALTPSLARDAAERVAADYEPLAAVTTTAAASAAGAIELCAAAPGNLCLDWSFGDEPATAAAFAAADQVVALAVHNHRIVHNPMEPRGARGRYDAATGTYSLDLSSQNVHVVREHVARSLGVAPACVEVRAPDVGGGFGTRNFAYAEYVLVLWAARELGRPVKWLSTRSEGFVSDHQARDFDAVAELALAADGRFLGLRVRSAFNAGGYMTGVACGVPTGQYVTLPGGLYDLPTVHLAITVVLTNTVPIGVTRGPGFAETIDLIERLVDKAALESGHDRFALRRRNMVPRARMPWTNAAGTTVDSGDFPACLDAALLRADLAGLDARRRRSESRGRKRGFGVACHVKATAGSPEENVEIAFDDDAAVLTTGTQAIGQGHETTFRQIVSSLLGLPPSQVRYRAGDTTLIPTGGGHGSSRATYMAGTAMARAAQRIVSRGRALASSRLEAAESDIEFDRGSFRVVGTDRTVGLLALAQVAREAGEPLDTYEHFVREAMTFPNGCHAAEVEVDPDTGVVSLERYTAVDDYGVLVNPMIVAGQVHGGVAQGVGQALLEHAVYDPGSGQLLSGSFLDYCLPRADDLPAFEVSTAGTDCKTNPLGVKGCGEIGAIAAFPALANAILDALRGYGVRAFSGPATPYRVWQLIRDAGPRPGQAGGEG